MSNTSLKETILRWCRKNLLTMNTIRYRVEYARITDAFRQIGPQQCVFDGGAGSGQMLRMLYEDGFCKRAFAYEYDSSLLAILKSNLADLPSFEARQGSLLHISYPDASMDCVMTTQVLEHIEDHETAAQELGRITKPGGHIVVSVPHPPEPFHTPGHIREGYTEDDLKALFPMPEYDLLHTGYSMTRPTMNRAMFFTKLPFKGCYIPVAWADCETMLTSEQRKEQLPYAITCLFRKN